MEHGTNPKRGFVTSSHNPNASAGAGGESATTGLLVKIATSDMANFANDRVPKQATSILFLRVIPYILTRGRVSWVE